MALTNSKTSSIDHFNGSSGSMDCGLHNEDPETILEELMEGVGEAELVFTRTPVVSCVGNTLNTLVSVGEAESDLQSPSTSMSSDSNRGRFGW